MMRKFSALVFVIITLMSSSFAGTHESVTLFFYEINREANSIKPPVFDNELINFKTNLAKYEKTLTVLDKLKKFSKSYGQMIVDMIEGEEVLTGEQLHVLTKIVLSYHHLSMKVLQFSSVHNLSKLENKKDFIQLNDIKETKKNLVWLSSHMVLFDHYLTGYEIYYSRGIVRRILKDVFKTEEMKNVKIKELGKMIAHTMARITEKNFVHFLKSTKIMKKIYLRLQLQIKNF